MWNTLKESDKRILTGCPEYTAISSIVARRPRLKQYKVELSLKSGQYFCIVITFKDHFLLP